MVARAQTYKMDIVVRVDLDLLEQCVKQVIDGNDVEVWTEWNWLSNVLVEIKKYELTVINVTLRYYCCIVTIHLCHLIHKCDSKCFLRLRTGAEFVMLTKSVGRYYEFKMTCGTQNNA